MMSSKDKALEALREISRIRPPDHREADEEELELAIGIANSAIAALSSPSSNEVYTTIDDLPPAGHWERGDCGQVIFTPSDDVCVEDGEFLYTYSQISQNLTAPSSTVMDEKGEREAFEQWARPRYTHPEDFDQRIKAAPGTFNNYHVQAAWEAWQARSAPAPSAAEPVVRNLIDKSRLVTAFCSKWSGYQKVEAGDVLDWIMSQPVATPPAPQPTEAETSLTDEQIDALVGQWADQAHPVRQSLGNGGERLFWKIDVRRMRSMVRAALKAEAPVAEPVAQWADPRVQKVYKLLCSEEAPPDPSEHWEGWAARRIVSTLYDMPATKTDEEWIDAICVYAGWGKRGSVSKSGIAPRPFVDCVCTDDGYIGTRELLTVVRAVQSNMLPDHSIVENAKDQ